MFEYNGWKCRVEDNNLVCSFPMGNINDMYLSGNDSNDKLSNFMDFVNDKGYGLCCVYSNHCGHCIRLMEDCGDAWNKVKQQEGSNGFLLLDASDRKDMDISKKLKIKVNGVPTTVVVQDNGKVSDMDRRMFIKKVQSQKV